MVCAVVVRPSHRRRGVGRELLRRAEGYLTSRGADVVVFGSQRPYNPYLFGLYGGANSPGILASDAQRKPGSAISALAKTEVDYLLARVAKTDKRAAL